MKNFLGSKWFSCMRLSSKKAQTLVEYALILAFLTIVVIATLPVFGSTVKSKFSQISSALQNAS